MPAKSKSQQRLFGMIRACQKARKCASKKIKKIAKSISKEDVKDISSTKHKGLPNRVKKNKTTKQKFSEWLVNKESSLIRDVE